MTGSHRGSSTVGPMPYSNPEVMREYQRNWLAARRTTWIAENGPCAVCGTWSDLVVDHIDKTTKSVPVSKIWSWSAERRERELAKCQVLCVPCHDEKSRAEGGGTALRHGTLKRYKKGCRCTYCRAANTAAKRKEREASKSRA